MECSGVREKLSLYIDGMLDEQSLEMVEAHLAGCEECRNELAALREIIQAAGNIETVEPPKGLHGKILQAIAEEEQYTKQLAKIPGRWSLSSWLGSYASQRGMQWAAGIAAAGCVALVIMISAPHNVSQPDKAVSARKIAQTVPSQAALPEAKPSSNKPESEVVAESTQAPARRAYHTKSSNVTTAKNAIKQIKHKKMVVAVAKPEHQIPHNDNDLTDQSASAPIEVAAAPETTADMQKVEQPAVIKVAAVPNLNNDKMQEWMQQAKAQAEMRKSRAQSGAVNLVSAKF